jgi:hypothetical protein
METNEERKCCRRRCWKFPLMIIGIVAIKSAVVMLLWNALIPELFHGPVLNYLQALGVTVLAKLLFGGGFRHRGGHHWHRLSHEERLKLREELRSRS